MMSSLMSLESSFHCRKPGPSRASIFFLGNGVPGMESAKGGGSHSERTAWGWHTTVQGIIRTDEAVCQKENLAAPRQGRRQMPEVLWSLLWVPPAFGQELCIAFGQ